MYVDSHIHLYAEEFAPDLPDVVQRARDAGVETMIVPGTREETNGDAVRIAERFEEVYACVGVHPHEAASWNDGSEVQLRTLARHPRVVGIGEIGLDYHYDTVPRESQQKVFRRQVELAAALHLPIVVHTRKSVEDAIGIVKEVVARNGGWLNSRKNIHSRFPPPRGVFHCFTGTAEQVWELAELGFFVSYPGIVTFRNSPVEAVVRRVGYDHILLETDAPYLAPVPHRGKRNEPSYLPLIAEKIAELASGDLRDVARTTRFNARRLFALGEDDPPVIVYRLRNSLYLNLTLRCNADCVFCDRKGGAIVKGYNLKILREPTAEELTAAIGDPTAYEEIVFCGYGEPTIRFDVVTSVARWVKSRGGKTRLNTDGHGNVINHRNIVPEMAGIIDVVSVSLNSADPDQYGSLMRLDGKSYFQAMVDFTRECKKYVREVQMTAVDLPGVDIERARRFAEEELGVSFRSRPYF
jgi:TatD DNase family protein